MQLRKPTCPVVKLTDVKPGKHGYNVYVKVIKVEHEQVQKSNGLILDIAQAVLADESGVINARMVGKFAPLLKQDAVIAIRNGRSEVYQEHHRLEIDQFGKITVEESRQISKTGDKMMSDILYETKILHK